METSYRLNATSLRLQESGFFPFEGGGQHIEIAVANKPEDIADRSYAPRNVPTFHYLRPGSDPNRPETWGI